MRLKVNIDEGFAIDLDKVCLLLRGKDPQETTLVLVSGSTCTLTIPLSRAIEIINGLNADDEELAKQHVDERDANEAKE